MNSMLFLGVSLNAIVALFNSALYITTRDNGNLVIAGIWFGITACFALAFKPWKSEPMEETQE